MNTATTMINSPVRRIAAKVELFEGSTWLDTYTYRDALISIDISRVGEENRFFGIVIPQRLNIHLRDKDRKLNISTANSIKVYFSENENNGYISNFPTFYVSEVHRDENTNEVSITAYDLLNRAEKHTAAELGLVAPLKAKTTFYTINDYIGACSNILTGDLDYVKINTNEDFFITEYPEGANLEGTESIRDVLRAIAEVTLTVCYVNADDKLVFKQLDKDGEPVLTIDKSSYITLQSGENRRLSAICNATESGDNITADMGVSGTTQYVRDNPFWDIREDADRLINNALASIGGITINQFTCSWRGNYLLEIGDKIALITKDNETVHSYVINDTLTYTGGLTEITSWNYAGDDAETATNPSTLGEAIKYTYARVDKVNKRIDFVANDANERIAQLQINTNNIQASVIENKEQTDVALESLGSDIENLGSRVDLTLDSQQVQIGIIQTTLEEGVEKVKTTVNQYTFDDEGLKIAKSDSELNTQITHDGMTVYYDNEARLIANSVGVEAKNLNASTYLIIGKNSRFEDFGRTSSRKDRTGCFWIGN